MKELQLLKLAKDLITDKNKWCQGNWYLDAVDGRRFTAMGVIAEVAGIIKLDKLSYITVQNAINMILKDPLVNGDLHSFNDENEHLAVLDVFNRVINLNK